MQGEGPTLPGFAAYGDARAVIETLAAASGARFVEVPVNYLPRVGVSSATGKRLTAIGIGLRMVEMIVRFRTQTPRSLPRPDRLRDPGPAKQTERVE